MFLKKYIYLLSVITIAFTSIFGVVFQGNVNAAVSKEYTDINQREFWAPGGLGTFPPSSIVDSAGITYADVSASNAIFKYYNAKAVNYPVNGGLLCAGGFTNATWPTSDSPTKQTYYTATGDETTDINQADVIIKEYSLRYSYEKTMSNTDGDNTYQCDSGVAMEQATVKFYTFYGNGDNPKVAQIQDAAKEKISTGSIVLGTYIIPEDEDINDIKKIVDVKQDITFTYSSKTKSYIAKEKSSNGKCNLEINQLNQTSEDRGGIWQAKIYEYSGNNCADKSKEVSITIQRAKDFNSGNVDDDAAAEEGEASCGDVGGVFGWLICEAAGLVDDAARRVEDQLYNLLIIPEIEYGDNGIYKAWSSVRNIATSVLVLVALFAIAAQIFNMDFVSAYTMRKIIPRIIIATILMFTSYFLATLLIDFVNALGNGIAAIIMAPFGDLLQASQNGDAIEYILGVADISGGQAAAGVGILFGIGAVAFIGAGGIGGIILVVALVAGAIIVAFVSLILRKVFILGLIMIMPLAIIAWILPNTQKWATSWWNMFTRLLFMFPLVMGLIALGRVAAYLFAVSAPTATGGAAINWYFAVSAQGSIALIMILIAYFVPYYFIPSMFKTAGGVFAKINGAMDGMGKKYGRKAGEAGGKYVGDKAASKYKAGADGKVQKYGWNAAARLATGNVVPGVKRQQKVAARASAYHKERNEQADFLAENTYASLGYGKGGEWLAQEAKKDGPQGDAALRMIAETKRFDLLDKVGGERVRAYADENRGFGAAVASQRRDLLDPDKVKIWAAKDAVGQHDSFFGSIDKNTGAYTPGSYMNTLSDATIDQIRSDKDLYNALGTAGKHYIDNFHGGPSFAGAPGAAGGNVTPPTPTTPSGAPAGVAAPATVADLQSAISAATGGTGNVAAASDGQLRALYAATAKSQDPVIRQTHIDLRNEVINRGSVTGPMSVNDIQTLVNGAIGPDGSRGIQHLSDTDLNRVLSSTYGSTDTTAQAFREAADQEYIKRSGLPPQN